VDPYARAGAVVELYVYSAGHEMVGYDGGKYMQRYQLAQVSEEHTFAINRPGPWIVSVPFGGQEPAASCEVAVQPMHRSTPVVSAPLASVAPTGVQHLAISKVSDANVRVESCVLDKGVVTATGSFRGDLPAIYNRVGSVLELYVYATPPAPGSPATQLADLTREQPLKMYANTNKSWAISGPIDTRLGQAARCEISVEETHNFEGAPNVYCNARNRRRYDPLQRWGVLEGRKRAALRDHRPPSVRISSARRAGVCCAIVDAHRR
jgi:hypothetical protein